TICAREGSFSVVSARKSRNDKRTTCPRRRVRLTSPLRTAVPVNAGAGSPTCTGRCSGLCERRASATATIAAAPAPSTKRSLRRESFIAPPDKDRLAQGCGGHDGQGGSRRAGRPLDGEAGQGVARHRVAMEREVAGA